jgi:hypothetical protein
MTHHASTIRDALLAAMLAAAIAGCCATCRQSACDCGEPCPNGSILGTACSIYHGTLADNCLCSDTGCLGQGKPTVGPVYPVTCGPDCSCCRSCWLCPFGLGDRCCQTPVAGPPPIRHQPLMPPKLLPVPTAPMLSPVRPDAPEEFGGEVETSFDPRLTSPGRN